MWRKKSFEALTAGDRTLSDRDKPSRSVTRLLDRKLLTGVTWGEGAGSTRNKSEQWESAVTFQKYFLLCILFKLVLVLEFFLLWPFWQWKPLFVYWCHFDDLVLSLFNIELKLPQESIKTHSHRGQVETFLSSPSCCLSLQVWGEVLSVMSVRGKQFFYIWVTTVWWKYFYFNCRFSFWIRRHSLPSPFSFWPLPLSQSLPTLIGCSQTRFHPPPLQTPILSHSYVVYASSHFFSLLLHCCSHWIKKIIGQRSQIGAYVLKEKPGLNRNQKCPTFHFPALASLFPYFSSSSGLSPLPPLLLPPPQTQSLLHSLHSLILTHSLHCHCHSLNHWQNLTLENHRWKVRFF